MGGMIAVRVASISEYMNALCFSLYLPFVFLALTMVWPNYSAILATLIAIEFDLCMYWRQMQLIMIQNNDFNTMTHCYFRQFSMSCRVDE